MMFNKFAECIELLKSKSSFGKIPHAEDALDAVMLILIEQQGEIKNLSDCVNFLQQTVENQVNVKSGG